MDDIINDLTDAEIDVALERLDQTERPIQRRILCTLILRYEAGQQLAEACRAIVIRCEKGFLETKWKGQPTIRDLAAAALAEWDKLEGGK